MMIWATVGEVRDYLDDGDIPTGTEDAAVQRAIDKAVRSLTTRVVWWPVLDDADEHVEDAEQRAHVVAAVAETVKARYAARALETAVGGAGLVELLAGGGSVTASKLSVSGGTRGTGAARIGAGAGTVPPEAVEALLAAGMIGGSVASC
ncbi:hypothetical protein [Saccharothrix stipae]